MNTQHRHDSAGIIQTRTGESAPAEPGSRRPSRRGLRRAPGLTLTIAFGAALAATGCNDLLNPGDENDPEETLVYEDDYLSGPRGEPLEIVYTFPGMDTPVRLLAELVGELVIDEGDIALGTRAEVGARQAELRAGGDTIALSHWSRTLRWLDADAPNASVPYTYEVPYETRPYEHGRPQGVRLPRLHQAPAPGQT